MSDCKMNPHTIRNVILDRQSQIGIKTNENGPQI
uniref:Uncharacterized protein n=1 Tax=Arundo donax TaxID=35708 RepID=A0A0A9E0N7_ARUDO